MSGSLPSRRPARSPAGALLVALLVVGGAAPATANPTYLSTVLVACDATPTTRSSGAPSDAMSCHNALVSAAGWTSAGEGFIRAHATATLDFDGSPETVSAKGQGVSRLEDAFVVSALDGAGSAVASGFLTAVVRVDAQATVVGGDGFASVLWTLSVGGVGRNGRALATQPFGNAGSTSGGSFVLQVPWTAGSPVGLTFFANAEALVGEQQAGSYAAVADFANSMEWLGITAVTDGAGTPVASFSALSPDGFDYAVAVPEPGSLALMASGLAGLAGAGSRRRIG